MAAPGSYDNYDLPYRARSSRYRDDRDPRYVETTETYVRQPAKNAPLSPDDAYLRSDQIIRRPAREDSDLSVEEIHRAFPPPDGRRAKSADRYPSDYYYDDRGRGGEMIYAEKTERRRSLSRNQKIIAAVSGAALAVGGKELWDRRKKGSPPHDRNLFETAAIGAAGAFAAYEGAEYYKKHGAETTRKLKGMVNGRSRDSEYYSSDDESIKSSKSAKRRHRRKSIVESAVGLAGLGAAANAVGHHERDRDRDRDRDYDRDSRYGRDGRRSRSYDSDDSRDSRYTRRSRSRGGRSDTAAKLQQAAKAALLAGATEAFRLRKQPGSWSGEKGKRILTAAVGAGGIDAAADHDPDHKGKRHILEAVIGGLTSNRVLHGSRKDIYEDESGRSRSRSRSRSKSRGGGGSGLPALAAAGLTALAGKKLAGRSRSRSRSRSPAYSRSRSRGGRQRRYSYSDDSRSPSPRRRRRSRSVTDLAGKGLAAIGIGEAASRLRDKSARREPRDEDDYYVTRPRTRSPSRGFRADDRSLSAYDTMSSDNPYAPPRGGGRSRDVVRGRKSQGQIDREIAEGRRSPSSRSSSSDLGSSTDDEKKVKKMHRKQLVTAGLATIATIHAAHNVYQSMEKREARKKAVQEGALSPAEAKKLKSKATLQDAASIGIAALGIKGAVSEWKEMKEMREQTRELEHEKELRHQKRVQRLQQNGRTMRRRDDGYRPAYVDGPHYADGNPYAGALPPPPRGP